MKRILVVVADLEHFRAFVKKSDPAGRKALEQITALENMEPHGKMSEKVTDKAGSFRTHTGVGENHNRETEMKKRTLEQVAQEIKSLLGSNNHDEWWLALPKTISGQVTDQLETALKTKLTKNLGADLTKMNADEILKHFEALGLK